MEIAVQKRKFNIRGILVLIPVKFFAADDPDLQHKIPSNGAGGECVIYNIEPGTGKLFNGPFTDGPRLFRINDEGIYSLTNMNHATVGVLRGDYVPDCLPRRNGDTDSLILDIRGGRVTNLPDNPTFSDFFFRNSDRV